MKIIGRIAFCILLLASSMAFLEYYYIDNFTTGEKGELEKLHYVGILLLTLSMVFVAYYQLSALNKTARSDFLLRIDSQWESSEIIKARKIIHEFYCDALADQVGEKYDHAKCIEFIQGKILEIEHDKQKAEDFIHLLNLIDFMETVSYFANKGKVDFKEVSELSGYSLIFFFEIFESWIKARRERFKKDHFYKELETLAKKLKDERCWLCKNLC